ncbi:MAG: hypothetical protein RLZZ26_300 [Candidatus Parcubacteria bacterium]|jgi:hypothetical protein
MQTSIVLELKDFKGRLHDAQIGELSHVLSGRSYANEYFLSNAGGLRLKGCGGETDPVYFQNKELFLRFSRASVETQAGFVEKAYSYLSHYSSLHRLDKILIEVEWTPAGKKRHISAHLYEPAGGDIRLNRKFFFDLA